MRFSTQCIHSLLSAGFEAIEAVFDPFHLVRQAPQQFFQPDERLWLGRLEFCRRLHGGIWARDGTGHDGIGAV